MRRRAVCLERGVVGAAVRPTTPLLGLVASLRRRQGIHPAIQLAAIQDGT